MKPTRPCPQPRLHGLRVAQRVAAFAWAAPNTALGLVAGLAVLGLGGRVQLVSGAIEFHGGALGRFIARPGGFGAITLGHVVLGTDDRVLAVLRVHERVHVRQCERWGVFFLPAYALSSAWQVLRGRGPHADNFFEKEAFAAEACHPARQHAGAVESSRGRARPAP